MSSYLIVNFPHEFPHFTSVIQFDTTAEITNCPRSMEFTVPAGQTSRVVTWTPEPTAEDGMGNTIPVASQSHQSGNSFPIGTTVVKYRFSDQFNIIECRFDILITGKTPFCGLVLHNQFTAWQIVL